MASGVLLVFCCAFIAGALSQQNGDIRLADTSTVGKGRLEVLLDGSWGTICYDVVEEKEGFAQVACRQLGYKNWIQIGTVKKLNVSPGSGSPKLFLTYCPLKKDPRDSPQHILRCDYAKEPSDGVPCPPEDHMALECDIDSREENAYDTMVDITDDLSVPYTSISSGLAQVYLNGEWGPVCNMKKNDADSLCRQLGYTNSVSVENRNITSDRFELLDSFSCTEVQPCLRQCFNYPKAEATVNCNNDYSYVTCTFDEKQLFSEYGTKSTCTYSNSGKVAGAVIGTLLILATLIAIASALVCLFHPACKFYKVWEGKKLRPSGLKISTGATPKYESI